MKPTILLVEDTRKLSEIFKEALSGCFGILSVYNLKEAKESFISKKPDGILLDLQLPDGSGIDLIPIAKEINPDCVIIVATAHGTINSAVEAMRLGASDYLEKPVDLNELIEKFEKKINLAIEKDKVFSKDEMFPISYSVRMHEILKICRQVAKTNFPVLITGESGVGKDVIANYIHKHSARKIFVPFNCANLPFELAESLLFGHTKGSFTGATENKSGLVESASEGTLFLDEIGELFLNLQPKLLRFLDSGAFIPIGGVIEKFSGARVIAATNRNLYDEVKKQKFREDLFFRLNNFLIDIPPLRERKEDIYPLIKFHLISLSQTIEKNLLISDDAVKLLEDYSFPGNVRELFNILDRASIFCEKNVIDRNNILKILEFKKQQMNMPVKEKKTEEFEWDLEKDLRSVCKDAINIKEKEFIINALQECKYNKTEVAKKLGISYKTLFNKMKKLGIE